MKNIVYSLFITSTLCLSLAGCISSHAEKSTYDQSLTEAAYRYLFQHNSSVLKQQASAFCIGTEAGNEKQLIAALSDVRPKVLVSSDCVLGEWAMVKETRQKALIFHVEDIVCESSDHCTFRGSYFEANTSASVGRYIAQRIDGRWLIRLDPEKPQAVS